MGWERVTFFTVSAPPWGMAVVSLGGWAGGVWSPKPIYSTVRGCPKPLKPTFTRVRVGKGSPKPHKCIFGLRGCPKPPKPNFHRVRGCLNPHKPTYSSLRGCPNCHKPTFSRARGCLTPHKPTFTSVMGYSNPYKSTISRVTGCPNPPSPWFSDAQTPPNPPSPVFSDTQTPPNPPSTGSGVGRGFLTHLAPTFTRLRYSTAAALSAGDHFLTASSHTQQWTPLRPEYTHRRCRTPRSSVRGHRWVLGGTYGFWGAQMGLGATLGQAVATKVDGTTNLPGTSVPPAR